MNDPTVTDPELYRVLFENDRVRVLDYLDHPGQSTHDHTHPDSVMVTLTSFERLLRSDGSEVRVELPAHAVRWLDAQQHAGTNTGTTPTHSIFVELKEPRLTPATAPRLGPSPS